jgi:hypothetical protein
MTFVSAEEDQRWTPSVPIPQGDTPAEISVLYESPEWRELFVEWAWNRYGWTLPRLAVDLALWPTYADQGAEATAAWGLIPLLYDASPALDMGEVREVENTVKLLEENPGAVPLSGIFDRVYADALSFLELWGYDAFRDDVDGFRRAAATPIAVDSSVEMVDGEMAAETAEVEDPDALLLAVAYTYLDSRPEEFVAWMGTLESTQVETLLQDPWIDAWYQSYTWRPGPDDHAAVALANRDAVKDMGNRAWGVWQLGIGLLLMGGAGNRVYQNVVQDHRDYREGRYRVERARFGAGKLVFTGNYAGYEDLIAERVEEFSDKTVVFA